MDPVERDVAFALASEVIATLREPFLVLDRHLTVFLANASFYKTFQVSEWDTKGRFVYELGNGQWDIPALRTLLEVAIPREIAVLDFEVAHDFPTIGHRNMMLNARRFPPKGENPDFILLAIEDVTDRKKAADLIQGSELRFRRLFQTACDGILILDATTGKIIDANPFMCGLLGYEFEEFLDKELWEIGLFQDKSESQAAYRTLIRDSYIRYEHLPLKTKDGKEVEVEFVSNIYTVGDYKVAQCNIRDITRRSKLELQAKTQAAELADMLRRKDEFLAMLSHELRNPLSPILNAMHLLRLQNGENLIQQEARNIIERQVGQLTHIVDDLLEVSRFTSGKIHFELDRLDMRGIIEHAAETVNPLVTRHRHTLVLNLPPEPLWVHADATRIEQVVVNLLNNAAKYTSDGGRIEVTPEGRDNNMVMTVHDNGVGINLQDFPNIFDLFSQADRSLERSQGGLGVGLALVHRLVQMHNGTVEVQSTVGLGSTFTVRIPLMSDAPVIHLPLAPVKNGDEPHARVLMVDDNVDSADVLAQLLRMSGHEVRTVYTGPAALEAAGPFDPAVILLDIGLPGLNGYEVCRRLRQRPQFKKVWIIAMTGYGQKSDIQLAKEAGFDDHVAKPTDFVMIQKLLVKLLSNSEERV